MKQELEPTDRFVPMDELTIRLGTSRDSIYRAAKKSLLRLRRMNGKAGMLDSEVRQLLASLPVIGDAS